MRGGDGAGSPRLAACSAAAGGSALIAGWVWAKAPAVHRSARAAPDGGVAIEAGDGGRCNHASFSMVELAVCRHYWGVGLPIQHAQLVQGSSAARREGKSPGLQRWRTAALCTASPPTWCRAPGSGFPRAPTAKGLPVWPAAALGTCNDTHQG